MNRLLPLSLLLLSLCPVAVYAETNAPLFMAQAINPDDDDDRPELFEPEAGDSDASNFEPEEGDSDPDNFRPEEGDSNPDSFERTDIDILPALARSSVEASA